MQIYSMPGPTPPSGVGPNIVMTQEELASGDQSQGQQQLMAYAQSQIRAMKPQLHEPVFDPPEQLIYRDRPVVRVNVTWGGATRIQQWIVFYLMGQTHVLVATATAAETEFRSFVPVFADVLGSVKLFA